MISREDFVKIKAMHTAGMYQKDIASQLGIHPKTVKRALARDDAPARVRVKRGSKLDGYRAQVDEMLGRGIWNGAVILRELQKVGYTGGHTILRDYIQPKRAMRTAAERKTVRFETPPGSNCRAIGDRWTCGSPDNSNGCTSSSTRWATRGGFTSGAPTAKMPNTPTKA